MKRNKIFKIAIQLFIFVLIVFAVRAWQGRDYIQGAAPIIVANTLTGEAFDLRKHQSKPMLVHFWATWCPICQFENDNIAALAETYPVITVVSWSGDEQEVAEYLQQENLKLPVIVDTDGEWAKAYGVKGVPASFILDKQGYIQFIETGYTSQMGLRLRLWWLK